MPLYYFDIHDGEAVAVDRSGTELPNEAKAREEATRALSEIAAEEIPRDGPEREFRIVVRDAERTMLFDMRLTFNSRSV